MSSVATGNYFFNEEMARKLVLPKQTGRQVVEDISRTIVAVSSVFCNVLSVVFDFSEYKCECQTERREFNEQPKNTSPTATEIIKIDKAPDVCEDDYYGPISVKTGTTLNVSSIMSEEGNYDGISITTRTNPVVSLIMSEEGNYDVISVTTRTTPDVSSIMSEEGNYDVISITTRTTPDTSSNSFETDGCNYLEQKQSVKCTSPTATEILENKCECQTESRELFEQLKNSEYTSSTATNYPLSLCGQRELLLEGYTEDFKILQSIYGTKQEISDAISVNENEQTLKFIKRDGMTRCVRSEEPIGDAEHPYATSSKAEPEILKLRDRGE